MVPLRALQVRFLCSSRKCRLQKLLCFDVSYILEKIIYKIKTKGYKITLSIVISSKGISYAHRLLVKCTFKGHCWGCQACWICSIQPYFNRTTLICISKTVMTTLTAQRLSHYNVCIDVIPNLIVCHTLPTTHINRLEKTPERLIFRSHTLPSKIIGTVRPIPLFLL